ncbi:response regulator transcription factor [Thiosocius teredinicola]|uniref:response regulator transcription factor n=1 Tax=Thiosocius teredinicola TaxID=1973002 RepID=UPI000990B9B3
MTRLLLCEDDSSVGQMIQRGLRKTGFEVDWVQQGYQALDLAFTGRYQSLVLDLMLPDIDGLALCRRLREQQITTPVLMLTARDSVEHKVDGFEAGADDYLTKPFAFAELLARMKALIRRSGAADTDDVVDYGAMRLDRGAREVFCHGERVELTEREFQLLVCLAEQAGKVVSRERIIQCAWGADSDISDNAVDVYVGYLRKKMHAHCQRPFIRTVRGAGFKLDLSPLAV